MWKFDKARTNELIKYLYESNIHDAYLKTAQYDWNEKELSMVVELPMNKGIINFYFQNVDILFFEKGSEKGGSDIILSLSVEDDFIDLCKHINLYDREINKSIYVLFQMFSGDEMHIVFEELIIDFTE